MSMSYYAKITIFFLGCLALGVVIGTIGGVAYHWHKMNQISENIPVVNPSPTPSDNLSASTSAQNSEISVSSTTTIVENFIPLTIEERTACITHLKNSDENELANQAKNIRYPHGAVADDERDRINAAQKYLLLYFMGNYNFERKDEDYEKIVDYINNMDNITEDTRNVEMTGLTQLADSPATSFTIALADADYNYICPDKLSDLCINRTRISGAPVYEEWCQNLCDDITEYPVDTQRYKQEITEFTDWQNDKNYAYGQSTWRAAMAYRLEGRDKAVSVCDNLRENDVKNICIGEVDDYDKFNPEISFDKFVNIVCQ